MESIILKLQTYEISEIKEYIKNNSLFILLKLKEYLDDKYYNDGLQLICDEYYDLIKEYIVNRNPNDSSSVGYKVRNNNRIKLPYWLGSMDKIKLEEQSKLDRWKNKNNVNEYIVSSKLDGISCLAVIKEGNIRLYTRGDGVVGSDISHLFPYISNIPKNVSKDISIRGELLIPKDIFNIKYSNIYQNPRNMICGLIESKVFREGMNDIKFIVYEIIDDIEMIKPEYQLNMLYDLGFSVVTYEIVQELNPNILKEIVIRYRNILEYEIDGVVVQTNIKYIRNSYFKTKRKNPLYSFAFKIQGEKKNSIVKKVEWNISKWGTLKPVIYINPIKISGATISKVTGHNAKFIINNKIGPNAIVTIIRSGDVIPSIIDIVIGSEKIDKPDVPYKWNQNKVDFIVDNIQSNDEVNIKRIQHFFSKLDIKDIAISRIKKMYYYGLNDIIKIISASEEEVILSLGSKKIGKKIYDNIKKVLNNLEITKLLSAYGIFGEGIGHRKIEILFDSIPDILTLFEIENKEILKNKILNVNGYSEKTTTLILNNINNTLEFLKKIGPYITYAQNKDNIKTINNTLEGKVFILSGFRDKSLIKLINLHGGKVIDNWNSKTTHVIILKKPVLNETSKIKKAIKYNIPIYDIEEFKCKFKDIFIKL